MRHIVMAGLLILPTVFAERGDAMGQAPGEMVGVACNASDPKAAIPVDFCPGFITRLEEFYPNLTFALADGTASPRVTLHILKFTRIALEAKMTWSTEAGVQDGMALGTAIADKALGAAEIATFLDLLIAQTPAPTSIRR